MRDIRIGDNERGYVHVGKTRPAAVMAEIGLNHNGSVDRACSMAGLAAESGADLVKFQYIDPPAMVHRQSMPELHEIYGRYALTLDEMRRVSQACAGAKVPFVCTVFDIEGAARMVEIGVSAFKIASCDMTHLPLLRELGRYRLPVILSTGLSDIEEVRFAVRELKRGGCRELILLHCVSAYPAAPDQVNLSAMLHMESKLHLPVGFSDHTEGTLAPALAACYNARMIEKHFTFDPGAEGPDHSLSLGPEDFSLMVRQLRLAEAMRGDGRKKPAVAERGERTVGRRGFYLAQDVRKGEKVRLELLRALKPWTEVNPLGYRDLRGKVFSRDLPEGSPLDSGDIEPAD